MTAIVVIGIVLVAGCGDHRVLGAARCQVFADFARHSSTARAGKGTTLGEIILDVDNQQCIGHTGHSCASAAVRLAPPRRYRSVTAVVAASSWAKRPFAATSSAY